MAPSSAQTPSRWQATTTSSIEIACGASFAIVDGLGFGLRRFAGFIIITHVRRTMCGTSIPTMRVSTTNVLVASQNYTSNGTCSNNSYISTISTRNANVHKHRLSNVMATDENDDDDNDSIT